MVSLRQPRDENIWEAFVNTVSGLDTDESIFMSAPSIVGSDAWPVALLSKLRLFLASYIDRHSESSQKSVEQRMGTVMKDFNCIFSVIQPLIVEGFLREVTSYYCALLICNNAG